MPDLHYAKKSDNHPDDDLAPEFEYYTACSEETYEMSRYFGGGVTSDLTEVECFKCVTALLTSALDRIATLEEKGGLLD